MAILYKLDGKEQNFQDRVKDCINEKTEINDNTTIAGGNLSIRSRRSIVIECGT